MKKPTSKEIEQQKKIEAATLAHKRACQQLIEVCDEMITSNVIELEEQRIKKEQLK